MSKPTVKKPQAKSFWTSFAQRVVERGGLVATGNLASSEKINLIKKELLRIRQKVLGTHPWKSVKASRETGLTTGEIFQKAWALAQNGEPAVAIKFLEQSSSGVSAWDEMRVLQAAIAYNAKWDGTAVEFLHDAVKVIQPARTTLFWGPIAIISNSYWSRAMEEGNWQSKTLMWDISYINKRDEFDLLVEDVMPSWMVFKDRQEMWTYGALPHMMAFLHLLRHASVVHLPVTGSFLGPLRLWREESALFQRAGIKTVLLPYGGDYYCYSRVQHPSLRHGLLANYPQLAKMESETQARLTHWQQEADCVLCGFQIDAMGRWDVTTFQFVHIDTALWPAKTVYSQADGRNGAVSIMHTPNHRGFKGTEFLIRAVDDLRREGLQVDLRLLEKVTNEEVRRLMPQSDILAEQFNATAYALSGIEGMASGVPVMANLDSEYYTRVFRRYSFLNECPILSTTVETLKENLRLMITQPALRETLGRAGRAYVEKYHSYAEARHLFGSIYDRILMSKNIDLMNLYHPLLSKREKARPKIQHPLVENRLPVDSPWCAARGVS